MSTSCRKRPVTWFALTTLLAVVVTGVALAKKPTPPPPPEPDPVPVEYQLTWIDGGDPNIGGIDPYAINDSGAVVGNLDYLSGGLSAFRWTQEAGREDLDDLSDDWIDLDTGLPVEGWTTRGSRDINESGQIVGDAFNLEENPYPPIRPYIFIDGVGFFLLPTPAVNPLGGVATMLNDRGDVMGTCYDGVTDGRHLFFWSPLNPTITTVLMSGDILTATSTFGNDYFSVVRDGVLKVYGYEVGENGALDYWLVGELEEAVVLGTMSSNGIVPFVEAITTGRKNKLVTKYYAKTFDANTGNIQTAGEVSDLYVPGTPWGYTALGGANRDGDFVYLGTDDTGYLYRGLEDKSYKLFDLLDEAAKDALNGEVLYLNEYAGRYTHVNNSSPGVPTEAPFDVIVSSVYPDGNSANERGFVLTPVELP